MKTIFTSKAMLLVWLMLVLYVQVNAQTITTVAGGTSGGTIGGTCGVAIDSAGNIYVAGGGSNFIKQITSSGTNIFGTGIAGFSGDNGPATAATFNDPEALCIFQSKLYVADVKNRRIRMINLKTNIVTTVASTALGGTSGIAIDSVGNIYVAGGGTNTIKQITSSGTNTFGTGAAGVSGDGNPAASAKFNFPTGLYISHSQLYVIDTKNRRIRVINLAANNIVSSITSSVNKIGGATSIVVDGGNNIFVPTGGAGNAIAKIDNFGVYSVIAGGNTVGSYTGDGALAKDATLNNPVALAINGMDLFIADQKNRAIRKITNSTVTLPLNLLRFSAATEIQKINLKWNTTGEINFSGFEVQRGVDAKTFETIGFVKGIGNGLLNGSTYGFTDNNPLPGTNYYRLKMKDIDGSFTYSPIVSSSINIASYVTAFPIPAKTSIEVNNNNVGLLNKQITVVDILGKTWLKALVSSTVKITVSTWPAGIYFIRFEDGSAIKFLKE